MTTNIGAQAADAVNEKLVERQKLEQDMLAHHQDLGTLISQRNENEMVKEVRKSAFVTAWAAYRIRSNTMSRPFLIINFCLSLLLSLIVAAVAATYITHTTN